MPLRLSAHAGLWFGWSQLSLSPSLLLGLTGGAGGACARPAGCPEFFSGKSEAKTPTRYREIRNQIINKYRSGGAGWYPGGVLAVWQQSL